MHFLVSLLDPEAADGGSQPEDGGGARLPAARQPSPLSLNPADVAPHVVHSDLGFDSSTEEKINKADQYNEEPQSSSFADQGASKFTDSGSELNRSEFAPQGHAEERRRELNTVDEKHLVKEGTEVISGNMSFFIMSFFYLKIF